MKLDRKNFLKLGFATLTGAALASTISTAPASANWVKQNRFKDVPEFMRLRVDTVCAYNVLSGYRDNTFRPYAPMTRAELIAAIVKINDVLFNKLRRNGYSVVDPTSVSNRPQAFVDVKPSHPQYQQIQFAYDHGITRGTVRNGKRYFEPNKLATRADAAVFFQRTFDTRASSVKPGVKWRRSDARPLYDVRSFKDVPKNHWAYNQICWFTTSNIGHGGDFNSRTGNGQGIGIAGAYPDGTFRPDAPVERWALTVYFDRLLLQAGRGQ